jgi:hypothetical protein
MINNILSDKCPGVFLFHDELTSRKKMRNKQRLYFLTNTKTELKIEFEFISLKQVYEEILSLIKLNRGLIDEIKRH